MDVRTESASGDCILASSFAVCVASIQGDFVRLMRFLAGVEIDQVPSEEKYDQWIKNQSAVVENQ